MSSPGAAVIEPDVAELLGSISSLLVGSVAPDGLPEAARGFGAQLVGADRVRILLPANAERTIANLGAGGRMALTTTHFVTLVSWQLKGRSVAVEPPTPHDRIHFDEYCAGCVEILHLTEGSPEDVIRRILPAGIVACVMDVEQVFDQTPGPEAGVRVAPVGA